MDKFSKMAMKTWRTKSAWDRFHEKVSPEPNSGCWLWTAALDNKGYGVFEYISGDTVEHKAHRVSFRLHKGDISSKMFVMHSCDNPACVNPDHLTAGTPKDNVADMVSKNRQGMPLRNLLDGYPMDWRR